MFVKIRVGFDKTLFEFPSRREAFAWVEENYDSPQELENMERYFYQDDRFIREYIAE
jgi:hypothetical protein